MPDDATYSGGCHCGAVRFGTAADLAKTISCNCSICTQRGLLLTFVPAAQFNLKAGGDRLADYQFAKKRIHHLFCQDCGVESFARGSMPDGSPMVAVNVRCLEGVDVASLKPKPFDGRSL